MKKFILLLFLIIPVTFAHAVLKEENLDKTIQMLYSDLTVFHNNINTYMSHYELQRNEYSQRLNNTMEECQEYALVLYTQQDYYIFGMSQACQHIMDTYDKFRSQQYPFEMWKDDFDEEIIRYSKLTDILSRISDRSLSDKGKADKRKCIEICKTIQKRLEKQRNLMESDNKNYIRIAQHIQDISDYNDKRFDKIRKKVFMTGSESYFTTLSHFGDRFKEFVESINQEYFFGQMSSKEWIFKKTEIAVTAILLFLLSWFISWLLMTRIIPKKWRKMKEVVAKRKYYIATATTFIFAISLIFLNALMLERYYFIMAMSIVTEYMFLVGIILLSLTLRLSSKQIKQGLMFYLPQIILAAILISYRIMLVSNIIVSFTLPVIFIFFVAAHLHILVWSGKGGTREDTFFSWLSFVILVGCTLLSWIGFRFLSLELMMFWLILLTAIQLIICIRHLLGLNNIRKDGKKPTGKEIWFDSLMDKLVIPILSLILTAVSLIWAAHIFSMSSWMIGVLQYYFINLPTIAIVSVERILWVIGIACMFNYAIYITKEILRSIHGEKYNSGVIPVFVTIGTIVAWGIYAGIVIFILDINNKGIIAAVGGVSMGVGFALKDTIDNLFCGLSLMLGRVRMGDVIECDGVRGSIKDIGIRSTIIETIDGSIIAFLNSQLFTKNFKNLTKNHDYELNSITVGIRYGEDVERARELRLENFKTLTFLAPHKESQVLLSEFAESSVNLNILVWTPVNKRNSCMSKVKEVIYKVFNDNNIDIPCPQQELHIIK